MGKIVRTVYPVFKMDNLIFDVNLYRKESQWLVPEHGHSYVELMLCTGGSCEHLINGISEKAEAGDIFVMHSGWTHELRIARNFEHITIAFTKSAPGIVAPELKDHKGFKQLFEPLDFKTARLQLSAGGYREAKSYADGMLKEYAEKLPGWQAFMRANFISLVAFLSRMKMEGDHQGSLSRLNGVITYIESNFRRPVKLSELAKVACLSASQLQRLFKKHYGSSPIDYLIKKRVNEAQRLLLLKGCELSVSELAAQCGFADGNYFCRTFKKATGLPPYKYRRRGMEIQ